MAKSKTKGEESGFRPRAAMKIVRRILKGIGIGLGVIVLGIAIYIFVGAQRSKIPDNINMSSGSMDGMDMTGMVMSDMDHSANSTPITALDTPANVDAPVKAFTLTAEEKIIDLGDGMPVDAYTYNGTIPGPEIRVQQGDLVQVTLVNKLPVSTTIHWHGIDLPNAEDGVAGVTQDAVKPGQSYTYRFVANQVGTYWYHPHQETSIELPKGLFGAVVVEPKDPPIHYDRDYTVMLHEWGAPSHTTLNGILTCHETCPETLTLNNRVDRVTFDAKPGELVRLRIANSGDDTHSPELVGAPFKVIALDGHDLNGPTDLNGAAVPIPAAGRADISFVMPDGPVALVDGDSRAAPAGQHPMAVFGAASGRFAYADHAPQFDFTSYGAPAADPITLDSKFDVQAGLLMSSQPGFFNGRFTLDFPINGKTYPNIPSIKVQEGDLVKIHLAIGQGIPFPHVMHIHGHTFTVLAHNGQPLTGSPVHLDSVNINPGETWDVAFKADNPGLWMLHCHLVEHDANGMDMMIEYPGISTPYTIGTASGNNPF